MYEFDSSHLIRPTNCDFSSKTVSSVPTAYGVVFLRPPKTIQSTRGRAEVSLPSTATNSISISLTDSLSSGTTTLKKALLCLKSIKSCRAFPHSVNMSRSNCSYFPRDDWCLLCVRAGSIVARIFFATLSAASLVNLSAFVAVTVRLRHSIRSTFETSLTISDGVGTRQQGLQYFRDNVPFLLKISKLPRHSNQHERTSSRSNTD